jgi:hypothetical protein
MAERGGVPQLDWIGMGYNRSFGRTPAPYFSVRLMHLGHVGRDFVDLYGGTMTWDQLGSLSIPWGYNETIKYNGVQPGWTYSWDVGTWKFTVTDDQGNKTEETIKTMSDLGITWDILESPQFSIHLTCMFENFAFLKAWKWRKGVIPDDPWDEPDQLCDLMPYIWGEFDKYLKGESHFEHMRLTPKEINNGDYSLAIDANITDLFRTMVYAHIVNLAASGKYPLDLMNKDLNMNTERVIEDREADALVLGNLLMIALFASIDDRGKPVYEPWMLWHLWQWMGKSSVVVARERVFDLSPWWG